MKFKYYFKKLTVFDLMVGTIVALGVIFFAIVFFRKPVYLTVHVKVGEDNVNWPMKGTRSWFSQIFYKGMSEKDNLGNAQAEVINVYSYDVEPNRKVVYLTLRLRSVYSKSSNQYSFKGKPLAIGNSIKLLLDNVGFDGLITNIEGLYDPRKKVTLRLSTVVKGDINEPYLETSGTDKYISDAINIGDIVTDSNGEVVIKVLEKHVSEAKRLTVDGNGQTMIRTNPLKNDLLLELEVHAVESGGRYYLFNDIPILIGERMPFNSPVISIMPYVTKIELIH